MSVENASQPRLRKDLLQAVQTLLDAHATSPSRLVLARQPLHLPDGISATPLQTDSPQQLVFPEQYQLGRRWPLLKLNSTDFPYLGCVVEGNADICIGFPRAASKNEIDVNDCHILRLPASSCLFLPPGIAYASGDQAPWEGSDEEAHSQILWMSFQSSEVLCHLRNTKGALSESQLSLRR